MATTEPLEPLPLPDEPPDEVPVEREVPLTDVFALDETLLPVLVLDNTVLLAPAVEVGDSAEPELTLDTPGAALVFAALSAEVEDVPEESAPLDEGVSSALPGEAEAPAPAPEDEPAVFPAAELVLEEELLKADWM